MCVLYKAFVFFTLSLNTIFVFYLSALGLCDFVLWRGRLGQVGEGLTWGSTVLWYGMVPSTLASVP